MAPFVFDDQQDQQPQTESAQFVFEDQTPQSTGPQFVFEDSPSPVQAPPVKQKGILESVVDTFTGAGARVAQGVNESLGAINKSFGLDSTAYDQGADYWKNTAEEAGSTGLPAKIYEGVGAAPAGVAEFMAGPVYAGVKGAVQGYREGGIPGALEKAAIEVGRRAAIGKIFHGIENTIISGLPKAAAMGGTMGAQTAAEQAMTEQGIQPQDVAASAITGTLLSVSGGGRSEAVRQNLIREGVQPEIAADLAGRVPEGRFQSEDQAAPMEPTELEPAAAQSATEPDKQPATAERVQDIPIQEAASPSRFIFEDTNNDATRTPITFTDPQGRPLDVPVDTRPPESIGPLVSETGNGSIRFLDPERQSFIKDKVEGLGSVEAVDRLYPGATPDELYARQSAREIFQSTPEPFEAPKFITEKMKELGLDKNETPDPVAETIAPAPLEVIYHPDKRIELNFADPPTDQKTITRLKSNLFEDQGDGVWVAKGSGKARREFVEKLLGELQPVDTEPSTVEQFTTGRATTDELPLSELSIQNREGKQAEMFPAGPGAMTETSKRETPPDITQLRQSLDGVIKPSTPMAERIQIGKKLAESISGAKDAVSKAMAGIKGVGEALWSGYRNPPEWTDFKDTLGKYTGERQKTSMDTSRFAKEINRSLTPDAQEGVTNWIEAGGDRDVLQQRMDATSNPKLRKGYKAALNLDEDQINLAQNIRNYFDSRLDQAQEAGVIDQGVESYVNHVWDRDSAFSRKVTSEVNAGLLRTNPSLAKQRVWETFFQGEQAGGTPKDKRIGYLVTAYDQALNEAIAARTFIKSMLDGTAKDGRPLVAVSGSGKPVVENDVTQSYIIKPNSRPEDTQDYRHVTHPALRKWKWAASDADGKPIIIQGDMLVHPEVYRHLNNVLGKSAIREYEVAGVKPGKLLLNGMQELKSTLLSLSGFHQVQEGVHAVGHEVNPFSTPKIDLDQPLQRSLVEHGLMVFNHNALQEFGEGAYSSGLINRLPVLGEFHKKYGEYLFSDYIPRLKMKMATDAYERNTKRYGGKLTDDQIQELTAKQANAAFGELNYQMLGRNKTLQDVFRLAALAPDFLEARTKFVAQALKPYGTEQAAALIRLSAIMAITAQVTNQLLNGGIEWSHPFSVKINGKYYTLRSVPGDIMHLFHDPRGFSYNRLNPTVARPIVEALTGRDSFGRQRSLTTQIIDWGKAHVPIPIQGPLWKADATAGDAVLQSLGIGSVTARTPAEQKARELMFKHLPLGEKTSEEIDKSHIKGRIIDALRNKDPGARMMIAQAKRDKLITAADEQRMRQTAAKPQIVSLTHSFDFPQALQVWEEADSQERAKLKIPLIEKGERYVESHPDQAKETNKQLRELRRFVGK